MLQPIAVVSTLLSDNTIGRSQRGERGGAWRDFRKKEGPFASATGLSVSLASFYTRLLSNDMKGAKRSWMSH